MSNFHQLSVHVTYGNGLVTLRRRCKTLCAPGFMNDVTFAHYDQE